MVLLLNFNVKFFGYFFRNVLGMVKYNMYMKILYIYGFILFYLLVVWGIVIIFIF